MRLIDAEKLKRISIHAPRVGSDDMAICTCLSSAPISIHAPRVGSDEKLGVRYLTEEISIHAPRVGSDRST